MALFSKINICYLPPYSPFLNAIEEVFHEIKYNFRKENILKFQN